MAETTAERKSNRNNDWSTRSNPRLLKGRKGKVYGDLRDLDTIIGGDKAEDEDMDSGKDIFSMGEAIKEGDKGERLNTYKMEEK